MHRRCESDADVPLGYVPRGAEIKFAENRNTRLYEDNPVMRRDTRAHGRDISAATETRRPER